MPSKGAKAGPGAAEPHLRSGNAAFAKRSYEEALKCYDSGLAALGADGATSPAAVDLICNKAACWYQLKK